MNAKVHNMLSQQMKSCDSFEIETVGDQSPTNQLSNSSLTDTSSIALTNYNIQRKRILRRQSPTRSPTPNNIASTTPNMVVSTKLLHHLLQRLTVETLFLITFGESATKLPPLNWIYSYFGDFSQSTACNATRFRECSLTSLDKLWYTYSYIYQPKSTTVPNIRYKFESLHASPF